MHRGGVRAFDEAIEHGTARMPEHRAGRVFLLMKQLEPGPEQTMIVQIHDVLQLQLQRGRAPGNERAPSVARGALVEGTLKPADSADDPDHTKDMRALTQYLRAFAEDRVKLPMMA